MWFAAVTLRILASLVVLELSVIPAQQVPFVIWSSLCFGIAGSISGRPDCCDDCHGCDGPRHGVWLDLRKPRSYTERLPRAAICGIRARGRSSVG